MNPRTTEQNAAFHRLLNLHKFDREEKAELVRISTGGRVTSSADMSQEEMQRAINRMTAANETSIRKMRAKIYNIARDIFGMRATDQWEQRHYDAVDKFMLDKYKVPVRHLTYEQLPKAVTSMEAWRKTATKKMIEGLLNGI